jgi:quinol monooxygenase YgiN
MIVRVWEAEAKPDKTDRLLDILKTKVMPRLAATDGFISAEIARSLEGEGEDRVVVISRWRDEKAIAAYAGPLWRIRAPFVDFEMGDYMAHTSRVRHYVPVAEQRPLMEGTTPATPRAEDRPS